MSTRLPSIAKVYLAVVFVAAGVSSLSAQEKFNDASRAHHWEQRALRGDPSSMQLYGNALVEGRGLPRDEAAGFHWLSLSLERGNLYACFWLAKLYASGTGTSRDPVMAYALAEVAQYQGSDPDWESREAAAIKRRPSVELTREQVHEAEQRALKLLPEIARLKRN